MIKKFLKNQVRKILTQIFRPVFNDILSANSDIAALKQNISDIKQSIDRINIAFRHIEHNNSTFKWLSGNHGEIIENNDDTLPVSVILTVIKSRYRFTNEFVIPMIKMNNPAEIIIIDDENMGNQEKRNKGAGLAKSEYLFFCDDDTVIPRNHLNMLVKALRDNPSKVFAYTDYQSIVMKPDLHPMFGNYYHSGMDFNAEKLKMANYIDTSSLLRRDVFPGFDPEIKRLQDWDLWLTIVEKGYEGVYVKDTGIIKYYLDEGITSGKIDFETARLIVKEKHKI